MTDLFVILGSLLIGGSFVGGFCLGMWFVRHNERVIDKPVVEVVEKPVYRDIITPAQPKQQATQVRFAPDTAQTREQRQEAEKLTTLLNDNPEI